MTDLDDILTERFGVYSKPELDYGGTLPLRNVLCIRIPDTFVGLHGTLLERSNHRRIAEDFPYLKHDDMTYGGPLVWAIEEDWTDESAQVFHERLDEIVELIEGLEEYPVYDESDHSDLEFERIQEEWEEVATCDECDEVMMPPEDELGDGMCIDNDGETVYIHERVVEAARAAHKCGE